MNRLLFIFFLLFPISSFAQTLSGTVVDEFTGEQLYPVTVVNLSTQKSSYTDAEGKFNISILPGQTVSFSFIGYEHVEYTVTSTTLTTGIKIKMHVTSYQLNEFIIRPDYTPYQIDSIENKRKYAPALSRQHSTVMSPISFIAERISPRSKQLFRFQKNLNKWENQRFIDTRYTPQLVQSQTGLKGDSIGYFMNAYPMEYDYARAATELELKMWVRFHYKEWLKNGTPVDSTLPHKVIIKPE